MKESILISDEAYNQNMNQLWRAVKRFRNEDKYKDVKYNLTLWVLSCDNEIIKQKGPTDGPIELTALFDILPLPPTNGEMLAHMAANGADVASDLPVMLTGMIEIEYTTV